MDGDDGLGIDFSAEHDHEADDDKDKNIDGVSKITEDLPKFDDGSEHAVASTLGVSGGRSRETNVVHKVGKIAAGRGGAVSHHHGEIVGFVGDGTDYFGFWTTG